MPYVKHAPWIDYLLTGARRVMAADINDWEDGIYNAAAVADAAVPKSTATTKGDLLVATGPSAVARLGVGADGQVLTADSTQTDGLKWQTPASGGAPFAGRYQPGQWDEPGNVHVGGSAQAIALTAGTLYCVPMWVGDTSPLNVLRLPIQVAGGAGAVVRLGLYTVGSDGYPDKLVVDCGTADATTTGDKMLGATATLAQGVYFKVCVTTDSTVQATWWNGSYKNPLWWGYNTRIYTFTGYDATAALPATAVTTGGPGGSGAFPNISANFN